jgi:hypothetical protein
MIMWKRWAPVVGALFGGAIAAVIAWMLAGDEVNKLGDNGAARFVGMVSAFGAFVGFFATARLVRGATLTRDGFTLSYRPLEPIPVGYRELTTLTVDDLMSRIRDVGYTPQLRACDDTGERISAGDPTAPLVGANISLSDPGVRGWVRVHLPRPAEGQARALGLIEVWSEAGESAQELALFVVRALNGLVGNLAASRESSRLSEDRASLVIASLAERPIHRRAR